MAECPVCGAAIENQSALVQSELLECRDCGTQLEVKGVDPLVVAEAPQEEEDWGE